MSGIRIKDATPIDELQDHLLFAVGNTEGDTDGCVSLGQVKDFTDADKAAVCFTGDYNDLENKPNLNNYVQVTTLNQNYYNKQQVNSLIHDINGITYKVVEELPEEGEPNIIYLMLHENTQGGDLEWHESLDDPISSVDDDVYDEYVWLVDGETFERIGSTAINFSNYYDKEEVDAMIPSVGNGTITITQEGVTKGTFTTNQSGNTTIALDGQEFTQEQADWNESDVTDPAYIKNKPSIPVVNDTEITFTQGGVLKGSITLNQSTAQTISLDAGGGSGSQEQADWEQSDSTQVDFIKNKPDVISLVFEYDNGIVEDVELYVKSRDSHRDYLWVKNRYAGSNTLTLSTASSYSPEYHAESVEYSKDKENWTLLELEAGVTHTIQMSVNEVVYFRNDSGHWNYYNGYSRWYTSISCSQPHDAGGDPYSLVDYTATDITGFSDYGIVNGIFDSDTNLIKADKIKILDVVSPSYNYYKMFYGCTSLTSVPALPATTLSTGCYQSMFQGCTSLTSVPQLPATTLAYNCYYQMFQGCTSLTTPQQTLPATTLEQNCYNRMFYGCTSLTSSPSLPATTLADHCYSNMFYGCTGLTSAPQLPATTLALGCYYGMFNGCTSLTSAPSLPATTVAEQCYQEMFRNCTSLTSAPALPATTLAQSCYSRMFQGCTSLTTPQQTLPATTLALGCYYGMFNGCTGLTSAPALPATTLTNQCYFEMFSGCTSLTTAPTIQATTAANECCRGMFQGCTSLTTVQQTLPVTTLANKCFMRMFSGCTALTTLPELPATTVADYCYQEMFANCTSLTTPQQTLPATTLATGCYFGMFNSCSNLTSAPALPATTLAQSCYDGMFTYCRSLTTPPTLQATTLAQGCYSGMFTSCSNLTSAPALPATTLLDYCYSKMFRNCTSLNDVTIYADDISATDCIKDWLKSVAATGTLHNLGSAVYPSGDSGIPTGWTETNS